MKRAEPTMHALSILLPLATASAGAGIYLFSESELGMTCWIGEYPKGCSDDPAIPCTSTIIGWIYAGIPRLGSLAFLIISNAMIYRKVLKTTERLQRYALARVAPPRINVPASFSSDDVSTGHTDGWNRMIASVGAYF